MLNFESRPIIALDFASFDLAKEFINKFPADEKIYVKVGMELYYQAGAEVIHYLKEKGYSVFLDLKLHDIPNTIRSTMKVLAQLGVDMVNVHAAGGQEMMRAAKSGLIEGTPKGGKVAKLIAVTQLTSTSEKTMKRDQKIDCSLIESVLHYACITMKSGLDGVVCSALEVKKIKAATNEDFLCITPGIRPTGSGVGDQKRVTNPGQARSIGSDYIVVGRPITKADNPVGIYHEIKQEWSEN
ncbi:orotidine-5'-phosphate decarboxylase [Lactovum miscens]|uniref:Orotidine 5'-phosphate decarboxylase n=1 Tax=Lactovum miscens TaxID=190387 RepID=A0A841C0V1_9LACT|nr:orotidine-5'-phosphate decarboxylase [Lactovum miscens]MBB5887526.1 orotidine-5'-phosphate decarboxylase [Lactovum miscens]